MPYRSSPLNPHARGVGERIKPVRNETVEQAVTRAVSRAEDTHGNVTVRIGDKDFTVGSTDAISKVVEQVKRDLGLPPGSR